MTIDPKKGWATVAATKYIITIEVTQTKNMDKYGSSVFQSKPTGLSLTYIYIF